MGEHILTISEREEMQEWINQKNPPQWYTIKIFALDAIFLHVYGRGISNKTPNLWLSLVR